MTTTTDPQGRPDLARIRTRIANAIVGARHRDQWTRTHCTRALTASGRGVTHNPACDPWPVSVRWNAEAVDALNLRRPHPEPEPEPATEPTREDVQRLAQRVFANRRLR